MKNLLWNLRNLRDGLPLLATFALVNRNTKWGDDQMLQRLIEQGWVAD
jgi:hypothetical protein